MRLSSTHTSLTFTGDGCRPGDEERKITRAYAHDFHRNITHDTLSTVAVLESSAATAECKLPGNLIEAVKRGWEIIHFRPEVYTSEPGRV
jgi:hypothetical protein